MKHIVWLVMALISLLTVVAHAEITIEDIAGMWLFEEDSGDVAGDSSLNGNDATFNNGPKWAAGKFGKGVSLDGADDDLSAQDSDSLDVGGEEMTIVAWVNADGWPSGWNHIVRKTPENPRFYILGVHDTSLAFIFLQTDAQQVADVPGTTALPTGEWIHLAMTYDGAEAKIYFNGEVDATAPASGAIQASDGELRIGRGDLAGYLSGVIDEIAVFNVALSQDEIKEVMDKGLVGFLSVEPQAKLVDTWGNIKAKMGL